MRQLTDREISQAIDKITVEINSGSALNTLHACRPGHPLNNPWQWRNAWFYIDRHSEKFDWTEYEFFKTKAQEEWNAYDAKTA